MIPSVIVTTGPDGYTADGYTTVHLDLPGGARGCLLYETGADEPVAGNIWVAGQLYEIRPPRSSPS